MEYVADGLADECDLESTTAIRTAIKTADSSEVGGR